MKHKRGTRDSKSLELKVQWQAAHRFASEEAFRDRIIGETICLTTVDKVVQHLATKFEQPNSEAVPDVEPGLVLRDSTGEGAFQSISDQPSMPR
jgi:hypothetical protein